MTSLETIHGTEQVVMLRNAKRSANDVDICYNICLVLDERFVR